MPVTVHRPGESLNGAALRQARAAKGWTQMDLAMRAGVTPGDVSRLERATHDPLWSRIVRIARVLDINLNDLAL